MKYNPKNVVDVFRKPDPGLYKVKIEDAQDARTETKQEEMIVLTLEILEGPFKGCQVKERIVESEQYPNMASTKIDEILRSCDRGDKLDAVKDEVEVTTQSFIGLTGNVKIVHNTAKNGKVYANVDYWVTEDSNGIAEEVEKAMNTAKPTTASRPPRPGTKTVDGVQTRADDKDDIPF